MTDFTGRTVLITGAAGGIGAATARTIAAAGGGLVLHDLRREGALAALVDELGDRATALTADLSHPAAAEELWRDALASRGQIDVLITWQPAVGAFLRDYPDFEVIVVPNTRALGAPEQYTFPMSMGVREGNEALKTRLDQLIQQHQEELTSSLSESGVKLYRPE